MISLWKIFVTCSSDWRLLALDRAGQFSCILTRTRKRGISEKMGKRKKSSAIGKTCAVASWMLFDIPDHPLGMGCHCGLHGARCGLLCVERVWWAVCVVAWFHAVWVVCLWSINFGFWPVRKLTGQFYSSYLIDEPKLLPLFQEKWFFWKDHFKVLEVAYLVKEDLLEFFWKIQQIASFGWYWAEISGKTSAGWIRGSKLKEGKIKSCTTSRG